MKRILEVLGAIFFFLGSTCFLIATLMPEKQ